MLGAWQFMMVHAWRTSRQGVLRCAASSVPLCAPSTTLVFARQSLTQCVSHIGPRPVQRPDCSRPGQCLPDPRRPRRRGAARHHVGREGGRGVPHAAHGTRQPPQRGRAPGAHQEEGGGEGGCQEVNACPSIVVLRSRFLSAFSSGPAPFGHFINSAGFALAKLIPRTPPTYRVAHPRVPVFTKAWLSPSM